MTARRLGSLAAIAALVAACASAPEPSVVPAVDATAPSFAGAPVAVRERTRLPACGVEAAVRHGDTFSVADTTARACFWAAYVRGQPAELVGTLRTETGLVTIITRSLGSGRAELFTDTTQLPGSDRSWTLLSCNGLQQINDGPVKPDWAPGIPPTQGSTTTSLSP